MDVEVLRPKDLPADLAERWRGLQSQHRAWDSPFLSPDWACSVEAARGDGSVQVAVVSKAGEPRAFMAATVGRMTAIAAGGAMCDYEGLVGDPGPCFDPRRLLSALGVGRYDFSHVLDDSPAFAPFARGHALSWIVDLPDGYDVYARQRRAAVSALKEFDRKRRKVEREIGPIVFTAKSASKADLDRMIALKREQYRGTGQTDIFAAGWTLRLVEALFALEAPGCGGALFTLHIGGELAAAQFHLTAGKTIHAWLIAHELRFERYSPGLLLFQDILRWMDGQPYDRFDLGYGDYRFKTELSNVQQRLMHGFVGAPSAASLAREAAYGVRRMAEALPLGPASELPGKAMRRLDLLRGLR
ncbi:MAG TPA: GNAT family N-acetyltransferase [Caulobacteraceae bacterium]|nr:GNAT family N-acetyltransferase [Caulobacteraceae bacterium]